MLPAGLRCRSSGSSETADLSIGRSSRFTPKLAAFLVLGSTRSLESNPYTRRYPVDFCLRTKTYWQGSSITALPLLLNATTIDILREIDLRCEDILVSTVQNRQHPPLSIGGQYTVKTYVRWQLNWLSID